MEKNLIDNLKSLRKNYDTNYMTKYINRNYWNEKISEFLKDGFYIENLTDFSYSTCFTLWINLDNINCSYFSEEFKSFLEEKKETYYFIIEISTLMPYCTAKYQKVFIESGENTIKYSNTAFRDTDNEISNKIIKLIESENIDLIDNKSLEIEVDNVELELCETPTIYNCLFQDEF